MASGGTRGMDGVLDHMLFSRPCPGLSLQDNFGQLDGIVSFAELAQQLVAKLCDHFQVPGNSLESINAARNKDQSCDAWETAGLPTPKHYLIKEAEHVGLSVCAFLIPPNHIVCSKGHVALVLNPPRRFAFHPTAVGRNFVRPCRNQATADTFGQIRCDDDGSFR